MNNFKMEKTTCDAFFKKITDKFTSCTLSVAEFFGLRDLAD